MKLVAKLVSVSEPNKLQELSEGSLSSLLDSFVPFFSCEVGSTEPGSLLKESLLPEKRTAFLKALQSADFLYFEQYVTFEYNGGCLCYKDEKAPQQLTPIGKLTQNGDAFYVTTCSGLVFPFSKHPEQGMDYLDQI